MAESGVELLQYRNKRASHAAIIRGVPIHFREVVRACPERFARRCRSHAAPWSLRFIVNDRAGHRPAGRTPAACTWAKRICGVEEARAIVGREPLGGRIHAHARAVGGRRHVPPPITSPSARFSHGHEGESRSRGGIGSAAARRAGTRASRWSPSEASRSSAPRKFTAPAPIRWP